MFPQLRFLRLLPRVLNSLCTGSWELPIPDSCQKNTWFYQFSGSSALNWAGIQINPASVKSWWIYNVVAEIRIWACLCFGVFFFLVMAFLCGLRHTQVYPGVFSDTAEGFWDFTLTFQEDFVAFNGEKTHWGLIQFRRKEDTRGYPSICGSGVFRVPWFFA